MKQTCEHCGADTMRWFTPAHRSERAAVLLCMTCRRLTIVTPARTGGRSLTSAEHAA